MLSVLWQTARAASFLIKDGGLYHSKYDYELLLNGEYHGSADKAVFSLYDLLPETDYCLDLLLEDRLAASVRFVTDTERFTLDVRSFGAVGDGMADDTAAIQAAILACPHESRVLVPRGRYLTAPLFLRDNLRLELAEGADLLLHPDRRRHPVLPGMLQAWDENGEYNLGTWEGNPLDMHAALINGIGVKDVAIYGPGTLDGQAEQAGWWENAKQKKGLGWRGRMVFLNHCENITVQGLTVRNSPSWNLHPYFSRALRFLDLMIEAPSDSPNTDGLNPESCDDVLAAGIRFSLGDDCVALKSGKLYMGSTYKTPCRNIRIAHCLMEKGHGGVTIGSEMAGGARDVTVSHCLMRETDRGLRIKTRRGRGEQGRIDNINFTDVRMEGVETPLVINEFYFCDPDGHSDYVQNREALPVDGRTPSIGAIRFTRVKATGCKLAAAYVLGLPEKKVEMVDISDSSFSFAENVSPASPAMADGAAPCAKRGVIARNVVKLRLQNVVFDGITGEAADTENVDELIETDG